MKVTVIIAAAGSGTRMGIKTPKPFLKVSGKPLLLHSLEKFEKSRSIDSIILVVARELIKKTKQIIARGDYKKLKVIVAGGTTRARSVYNGLTSMNSDSGIVLIHDVARPLISESIINKCISLVKRGINCVVAVPVKHTIKKIDRENNYVISTLKRNTLWQAQTPQAFSKDTLAKAYSKLGKKAWGFKDDASIVEASGVKVKVVCGEYSNIKITTKEDLRIAEALLRIKD